MLATAGLALLLAFGAVGSQVAVWLEACSQASRTSGQCVSVSSSLGSGGLTLGATATTPGQAGSTASSDGGSVFQSPRIPRPPRNPVLGSRQCSIILAGLCRGQSAPRNPPTSGTRVQRAPTPPTQVSDLAAFQPLPPGIVIEPGSWSLPRVPTNIFSTSGATSQSGQLLGWPIEVQFRPTAYRWSYGDGTTAVFQGSGSSWGSEQFRPMATSHIYAAPGSYTVTLQVDYAVAYRFGQGPFVPVAGSISRVGPPATLRVLRVNTISVEEGCPPGSLVEGRCE